MEGELSRTTMAYEQKMGEFNRKINEYENKFTLITQEI